MPFKTCLIVDDEAPVRGYVKTVLETAHFQTFEAGDSIQAMRWVEKLGDALDLIVSDIEMPGGDGVTFVSSVRESFPALPIILISGYPDREPSKHPSTSFEFIQKPFPPETLLIAIEKAGKLMESRKGNIPKSSGSTA
jgi:DNA-binding NtrC family response regulator